jgi:hypothetical protein
MPLKLAIVTATTNVERAHDCLSSWREHSAGNWTLFNVQGVMGTVPAFAQGLAKALEFSDADIIACLHDDLLIEEDGWDRRVLSHFAMNDRCGLLGFGGATGLGDPDLYQKPYEPHQLARRHFISNMRDAEAHGERVQVATQVSCLDGFSLIGRREFWSAQGQPNELIEDCASCGATGFVASAYRDRCGFCDGQENHERLPNLFEQFRELGITHHCYDSLCGCYAKRLGWEVWMLPIACHHFGGRTAVSDQDYHAWAQTQDPNGDSGFWEAAHRIGYEEFRDCLPLTT